MFAHDQGWLRRMREAVLSGLTAEAAVERVQSDNRARMLRADRPLSARPAARPRRPRQPPAAPARRPRPRGRARLASRQRHHRRPLDGPGGAARLRPLAPARPRPRGGRADEPHRHRGAGARHSGRGRGRATPPRSSSRATRSSSTATVGDIQIRPRPDVEAAYAEKARLRARRQEQYRRSATCRPSRTTASRSTCSSTPGFSSTCRISARPGRRASASSAPSCSSWSPSACPRRSEQQALYKAVFAAAGDMPVTFRTLDIGGDKLLPYMQSIEEENPALGWRAIRIGLDRPGLLRAQVRAFSRRPAGRPSRSCCRWLRPATNSIAREAIVDRETQRSLPATAMRCRRAHARRDARGAVAAVPDRRDLPRSGLRFGRFERFHAVPLRRRPGKPPGRATASIR